MKQFYPTPGRLRRALTLVCAGLGLHLGALAGPVAAGAPVAAAPSALAARLALAPALTLVTVSPGGLGQAITLTGSDLDGTIGITINGADATANILGNTATQIRVRVPNTAVAYGDIVVTKAGASASLPFRLLVPPGNALAFDGTNDYVTLPSPVVGNFTIEFWMNTTQTGAVGEGKYWWEGTGLVDADQDRPRNDFGVSLLGNKVAFGIGTNGNTTIDKTTFSTTNVNDGRWHHVAATRNNANGTLLLYIDGVLEGTVTGASNTDRNTANINLGRASTGGRHYNGKLDELRIWNDVRSAAVIQADGQKVLPVPQTNLLAYYNFDQGTPATATTGANTGLTTLYDLVGAKIATLNNFALTSGNTTSNYVGSFVLNQPTATAATNRTTTGFTANWTAPAGVTATGYVLEVATDAAFANLVTGAGITLTTPATSYAVTGLSGPGPFYYRVRAVLSPVYTVSSFSNSITVCALPTAIAQNRTLPLTADGTATLLGSAFNNGSTANCGPAGPGELRLLALGATGTTSGEINEGGTLTLTAPAGAIFTSIEFASYGTPTGAGGSYALGSCHAAGSLALVQQALLGKNSATIEATNATFGDPCGGTVKRLAVRARYYVVNPAGATPAPELVFTCNNLGTQPVALLVTDAAGGLAIAVADVTITQPTVTATTWLGTVSTDWNNCRNWSFGKVPTATIDAVVPSGLATYPSVASGTIATRELTIGGTLTLGSAATLEVSGNLLYNSPAALGGTLVFTSGPSSVTGGIAQTIGGVSPLTVNNLYLRKTNGSVQLLQSVTVTGSLQLATGAATTGRLLTGNTFAVTLGPSATIIETETAYVTGTVRTTRPVTVGSAQAFGGLGLTLTPDAGSVAPGSTQVVRTTGTFLEGRGTSQSILRYFQVTPATTTGVTATLVFTYFGHELNDILETNLWLFRNATTGTTGWDPQLSAVLDLTANTATLAGTTVSGVWTLGSAVNPLPVQLTRFEATPAGAHAVRLSWTTAQELNSATFVVERSLDGRRFEAVGTVAAAGTSSSTRHYSLLDTQLPTGAALLYYRLRQTDLDGKQAHSEVRTVSPLAVASLTLAPNPTQGTATLRGAAATVPVQVLDATGRLVLSTSTDASGTATLALPATLPRGLYIVRAGSHTTRLVLE